MDCVASVNRVSLKETNNYIILIGRNNYICITDVIITGIPVKQIFPGSPREFCRTRARAPSISEELR